MMKNKSEHTLENIYHRSQERIWDGREVLADLLEKHGGVGQVEPHKARALQRIFTVILEGENAAWKISLQLADRLDSVEARLAATSQAHDEARHFYVMRDYLALTGYRSTPVPRPVKQALDMVINTVVKDMGLVEIMSLISWQLRIFMLELQGLRELRSDFEALDLNIEDVFALAEKKQLSALQDFVAELGLSRKVWEPIRQFIRYQKGRILR